MICKNKYCYWHFDRQCVHESEDGYINATGEMDCPSSLRSDLEESTQFLRKDITKKVNNLSFADLIKLDKILNYKK